MSRIIKLVLIVSAIFFGLLFHLKNDQKIEISYYVGSIELPLSLALVLFICIGVVLGITASLSTLMRLKRDNLRLKKEVKRYQKELDRSQILST